MLHRTEGLLRSPAIAVLFGPGESFPLSFVSAVGYVKAVFRVNRLPTRHYHKYIGGRTSVYFAGCTNQPRRLTNFDGCFHVCAEGKLTGTVLVQSAQ
eukprot:2749876-Amphidinium_carterae.1